MGTALSRHQRLGARLLRVLAALSVGLGNGLLCGSPFGHAHAISGSSRAAPEAAGLAGSFANHRAAQLEALYLLSLVRLRGGVGRMAKAPPWYPVNPTVWATTTVTQVDVSRFWSLPLRYQDEDGSFPWFSQHRPNGLRPRVGAAVQVGVA